MKTDARRNQRTTAAGPHQTVVPASARRWTQIWNQEVKKRRAPTGVFAGRDVWFHGRAGFYNINRVAPRRQMLYGLTIYQLRRDEFRPTGCERPERCGRSAWTRVQRLSFR